MNDLTNVNQKQEKQNERIIRFFEQQLAQSNRQIEALTEQVRQLTKALYSWKSEKLKYKVPDGQCSLFEDDPSFNDSEHTEEIHHHPESTECDCCRGQMIEIGSTVTREEAKFIPAKMMKVQHIEHAYECKNCKVDTSQIKRGKAPKAAV